MARDYYKCADCPRKFFRVETAVNHKVATKHKILYLFDETIREAFV